MKCKFYGVVGAFQNFCDNQNFHHTSCVYVETPTAHLIFDAGTGLKKCEQDNDLSSKPIFLFLSHFHYDHILGLLFFNHLHSPSSPLYIVHPFPSVAEAAITSLFSPTFFPLAFSSFKRAPTFITPADCKNFNLDVSFFKLFHPGDSYAYKLLLNEKTLVYATDNELTVENFNLTSSFFDSASVLIHDCYFYKEKKSFVSNWGHSFLNQNLELAIASNVSNLCLFHHNPTLITSQYASIQTEIDSFLNKHNHSFKCFLTYDNFSLDF